MDNLFQKLMLGGSTAALIAVAPFGAADAQTAAAAPAPSSDIEQVVVSASRVSIAGYTAPTPVTVISAADINRQAKVDIGDSIRQLPSVGASDAPDNGSHSNDAGQGDAAISDINLRNLGVVRTLVLFDGQRVVASNPTGGGVDLSTIPATLVQRIDVVTGGASATWGSDAVSGVVNLVLNKNFDGIKGSINYADNARNTYSSYKGDMSFGTDFDGGRGHFILSGTYTMSPNAYFYGNAPYLNPITLIPNPAGGTATPTYIHQGGVGNAQYTQGGLIAASAAGTGTVGVNGVTALAPANALKGIQFTGPNATQSPFNYGTIPIANGACFNCSGNNFSNLTQYGLIAVPYHNTTLFAFARYKVTDSINASVQLNYGQNFEENFAADRTSALTIKTDNAYLPASIQARMVAGGIPSITLDTNNTNNKSPNDLSIDGLAGSLGDVYNQNTRQLMRGVFTLEGELGNDWSWNAYVQHSQIREQQHNPNNTLTANYNNAIDAVTVTSANVGNSGLAIGSVQCRSTLSAPTNGCAPLNVFGQGVASDAALNYIQPGRTGNLALTDQSHYHLQQEVVAGSVQGTLPWSLPAGKIAVAAGAEYRMEQQRNIADPLGLGATAGWGSGNNTSYAGEYNVQEGFVEVDAPLLKNNFVESIDAQVAGRITSYSTSGMVETWKLGLTSQINDDVKLRTVWSEDIRAPIISELFAPAQLNRGTNTDPNTGLARNVYYTAQGNLNLVPEEANTISAGLVLTPHWIDNLTVSVDFYNINIKQAIFTPNNTQVLANCSATLKVTLYCGDIFFAGGLSGGAGSNATSEIDGNGKVANITLLPADAAGALNYILNVPQNAASQRESGVDFNANYRMEIWKGIMDWSLLGNYTDENTRVAVGQTYDGAGALGTDDPFTAGPKLHLTLAATYAQGPWEGTVQGRLIGQAKLNNLWTNGVQVDNNDVPAVAYLDLRGSYKWNDNLQFYVAIDNTTNTPPPNIPATSGGSGTNFLYYDGLGRDYRGGIRFSF
jgi:outer membrane receptor protein involved in Fe transport